MMKHLYETMLFATVLSNASVLTFIAGVLRKGMNDMDALEFKRFVDGLVRRSTRSPFMLVILNVPALIAIPYFWLFGFGDLWITAGVAIWFAAAAMAKTYKLPIYTAISGTDDGAALAKARRRMNLGNVAQASAYAFAAVVMIGAFLG